MRWIRESLSFSWMLRDLIFCYCSSYSFLKCSRYLWEVCSLELIRGVLDRPAREVCFRKQNCLLDSRDKSGRVGWRGGAREK